MARAPGGEPLALLIGGCLGWVAGGWVGAAAGLFAGYCAERLHRGNASTRGAARADPAPGANAEVASSGHPAREDSLGERFFRAAFLTLGHLCKADGRVSREEIGAVERIMQRMSLTGLRREQAMQRFREGRAAGVTLAHCLFDLGERLTGQPELSLLFLEIMLSASWAEGAPGPDKRQVLQAIAAHLQINALEFARAQAQVAAGRRSAGAAQASAAQLALEDAYRVLGIPPSASEGDVRRAYRRLLSRHHPDKLVAQGLPGEWVAVANEHTHQVRRAWETIRNARGLR